MHPFIRSLLELKSPRSAPTVYPALVKSFSAFGTSNIILVAFSLELFERLRR